MNKTHAKNAQESPQSVPAALAGTLTPAEPATPTQGHAGGADDSGLARLLAPFMNLQVPTPRMIAAGLQYLLARYMEYVRRAENAARNEAAARPLYLPAAQLARRYGMTAKGLAPYLMRWTASGKVRRIAPASPKTGRAGVPRYHVADVDTCMEMTAPAAR